MFLTFGAVSLRSILLNSKVVVPSQTSPFVSRFPFFWLDKDEAVCERLDEALLPFLILFHSNASNQRFNNKLLVRFQWFCWAQSALLLNV